MTQHTPLRCERCGSLDMRSSANATYCGYHGVTDLCDQDQHTSSPWYWRREWRKGTDQTVVYSGSPSNGESVIALVENHADGILIAVAPDLLEALRALMLQVDAENLVGGRGGFPDGAVDAARAAIRLAEGETK